MITPRIIWDERLNAAPYKLRRVRRSMLPPCEHMLTYSDPDDSMGTCPRCHPIQVPFTKRMRCGRAYYRHDGSSWTFVREGTPGWQESEWLASFRPLYSAPTTTTPTPEA